MVDQAIYPVLFVSYLDSIWTLSFGAKLAISYSFILVSTVINLFGVTVIEKSMKFLTLGTLIPFLIYTIAGFASDKLDVNRLGQTSFFDYEEKKPQVELYTSVLLWATCGYEYTGFMAGDVYKPKKNFPKAIVMTLFLMILTYALPVSVSIMTTPDSSFFQDGRCATRPRVVVIVLRSNPLFCPPPFTFPSNFPDKMVVLMIHCF